MPPALPAPPNHGKILDLARSDPDAAKQIVADFNVEQLVGLVCETPMRRRKLVLELLPEPETVIPLLPEAELCFTVKALGLADAGWLLAHATTEQLAVAMDLDVWTGYEVNRPALSDWLRALAHTPRSALLRALQSLDPELFVLLLQSRVEVFLKPAGDEDWQPSEGCKTLEGQFYYRAIADDDDLEDVNIALHALFEEDYWRYFRMLQAVIWELPSTEEEFALRWRTGRLQDLGFPPREEAVSIYAFLEPEQLDAIPDAAAPLDVAPWRLPVWIPSLPAARSEGHRIFRAIAELEEDERQACFYAFVALANKVAVADDLPLSDAESTPQAIEKAARTIDAGLGHIASRHELGDTQVLRSVSLEHLFRVGANLESARARR
ncbi:MAG: DUF6178 family protein [Myxococcota bacterium]